MELGIFTNWLVNIMPLKKARHTPGFVLAYHNSVGHPSKALSPIKVIESGKSISFSKLQPEKALSPIAVIPLPSVT